MPLPRKSARESEPLPPQDQEDIEVRAKWPKLDAALSGAAEPGRPYQDFVENQARQYWQEIGKEHNLTKPTQQEIRTAAMPILCRALRNRTGHRRHVAVAVVVQHAYENDLIGRPISEAYESPSYIDALIRLADDANWLAREIHLPDHPPPRHPAIYYTVDFDYNLPVLREDSLIRADYVYSPWTGARITEHNYIYPWRDPEVYPTIFQLRDKGWDACYALYFEQGKANIMLLWIDSTDFIHRIHITPLKFMHFSPHSPAVIPGPGR